MSSRKSSNRPTFTRTRVKAQNRKSRASGNQPQTLLTSITPGLSTQPTRNASSVAPISSTARAMNNVQSAHHGKGSVANRRNITSAIGSSVDNQFMNIPLREKKQPMFTSRPSKHVSMGSSNVSSQESLQLMMSIPSIKSESAKMLKNPTLDSNKNMLNLFSSSSSLSTHSSPQSSQIPKRYQSSSRPYSTHITTNLVNPTPHQTNRPSLSTISSSLDLNVQKFHQITTRFLSSTTATTTEGGDSTNPSQQGSTATSDVQQLIQNWAELNYKGMEYLRVGNPADLVNAEECFIQGAKMMGPYSMMPFRSLSLANLASCKLRQGHYDEAIKLFQPLLTQLPMFQQVAISQIATIHMELASAYELSGRHDLAIKELYTASSRFVHAASHYLAAIQSSDEIDANPKKSNDKATVLRHDERINHISTAIECWRTALGCRYSAVVLQHKSGEFDSAIQQLNNIITVYNYYLQCADAVVEARKTSGNQLDGATLTKLYPECPPEAVIVTKDLVRTFPDLQDDYLTELLKITGNDICSVYHSLASIYLDSGKINEACEAFKKSVELVLQYNTDAFMTVASEGSKSLRLLYEKLLHVHSTYDPKTTSSVSLSDHFKLPIDNKQQLEQLIHTINQARVVIFGHFNSYVTQTMLGTNIGNTDITTDSGKLDEEAMKQINDATLKMRERIKSGQFYEDMRETYRHELGDQFDENNPDLVAIRPHGYVPVHERDAKKD